MTTKKFVERKPSSGFSITPTRTGYRVERWSTAPGETTDQVWHVSKVSARRYNPDGTDWDLDYLPYLSRGRMLLRHCEEHGPGVLVIRKGYEVRR
jgi:hypothetical protein